MVGWVGVSVITASALDLGGGSRYYGWYDAGATYVQDAKLTSFFDETVSDAQVKFDPGFRLGLGLGYRFTKYLSGELESGFQYNTMKSIEGALRSDARIYQVPLMANLVMQFPNKTRLVPFFGAGVGSYYTYLDADDVHIGSTRITDTSDRFTFAYQGMAGFRYDFSEQFGIGLSYRYSVADAPSWKYSDLNGSMKLDDLRSHAVCIHFGFRF